LIDAKGNVEHKVIRHAGLVPASTVPQNLKQLICGTVDPGTGPG